MGQILIEICDDRDLCGSLCLFTSDGKLLFGPVPVAARASSELAAAHGNPKRNPCFRYGDPPTGRYRLIGHRRESAGMHLPAPEYGRAGVLLLAPVAGEAALAEANGRYTICISGGRSSRTGRLRPTAGGFRLADADMRTLLRLLGDDLEDIALICKAVAGGNSHPAVDGDAPCFGVDPLSTGDFAWHPNRRQVLMGAAGGFGLQLAGRNVVFQFAGRGAILLPTAAMAPAPAWAEVAYHGPEDISQGTTEVDAKESSGEIWDTVRDQVASTSAEVAARVGLGSPGGVKWTKGATDWVGFTAELAGGVYGAIDLYNNGQKDAAIDAVESTLSDVMPKKIIEAGLTKLLAPELVTTTVTVSVEAFALGITLPESAIAVTSVLVVVGAGTFISLASDKVAELAMKHLRKE